ncbi:MAG: DnaJ domain-containing protein, partial [Caulobacter sp.]|nr:DnaJ domain-containing protein [Caulobacter sp.]
MTMRDYYEVLGVARGCDDAALKAAFRKMAMEHHPDRNGGCENASSRFKEVNEAYSVLSDPQKRAAYDRFGHAAFENGGGGGGGADFSDFMSDIFDSFFGDARRGGPRSANGRERGADLRYNLEIGLEEAFTGKNASIRVPTSVSCEACSGTGAKPGSKSRQCPTCGGHGRVRANQG